MKMLSTGVTMAWQVAARIAVGFKQECIEIDHLFIAIFNLKNLIVLGEEKLGIGMRSMMALKHENEVLEGLLAELKVESGQLRRAVQAKLTRGTCELTEDVIHRSTSCKRIFARAEELARLSGQSSFSCLHLLAAILEVPTHNISIALEELHVLPHLVKQKILNLANIKPVYATMLGQGAEEIKTCYILQGKGKKEETNLFVLAGTVVGSKSMMSEMSELELCCLLEEYNQLCRGLVDQQGGAKLVRSIEKGLLATFPTQESALKIALKIQEALLAKAGLLQLGLGIDKGSLKQGSGDIPESGAIRLSKMAEGGRILASDTVSATALDLYGDHVVREQIATFKRRPDEPDCAYYEIRDSRYVEPRTEPATM